MHTFELLLILVTACVALTILAQRLAVPSTVALILGGMALAFVPGLPAVELDPELAMVLFLPPLLQTSAYRTDWPAFRSNLRPILLLAVGAVFFTAATVAAATKLLVPHLPWWAAVALGAIVAPPDAVAATAVLKQVRLPKRIVTVLEGESLINDASSLVLYRFAVGAVVAGSASYGQGVLLFFGAALGGAFAGWLVARLAMWVFTHVEDTLLDIAVGLLAGFGAYLAAGWLHVSGVLAAVVCGLVLGRQQHAQFSARTRLDAAVVWDFVEFVLTALVFMLIGLQLRGIVERLGHYSLTHLVLLGAAVSLTLILSRYLWVFPSVWLPRALSPSLRARDPMPPWGHAAVLSWAGMRGVVSLAAALALPPQFPERDLIVFLAFCAILATLVLQGTTLGLVIRKLGVEESEAAPSEPKAARARAEVAVAALDAVQGHLVESGAPEHTAAAGELVQEYEVRAGRASVEGQDYLDTTGQHEAQHRLRLVALDAARAKLNEHRDGIDAEAHRALGEELDREEQQVRRALGEG